jgi:hypothetical protein
MAAVVATGAVVAMAAFDPWGFRPFTTLRWPVVAATMLGAAALAFGHRAGDGPDPAPALRRVRRVGAAFLALVAVATVTALDPLPAWIGHPVRHLGLLGWIVAAAGFGVGARLRSERARRVLGRGLAAAAAVVGGAALVELAGVEPAGTGFAGPRVGGLFGQPAYLGAAGVLLVPVAVAGAGRAEPVAWRWVARAGAVAAAIAVVASQTRGAWAGLAVAAAVGWPRLRPPGRAGALVAAGAAVAVLAVVAVTPVGARAWSTVDLGDGTTRGRVDEWRLAAAVIAERPWLGAGPEGYRVVAPAHIDDDYARRYGRDAVVDRAHDGLLDVAAAAGIPAAVLYAAGAGAVAVAAWRVRRDRRPLVAGAAAATIGYLVQQVVLFPVAELDPFAWLLAGLVVAAGPGEPAPGAAVTRVPAAAMATTRAAAAAVATVMTFVAAGAVALAGGADAVADRRLAEARRVLAAGDQARASEAADAATRLRPDSLDTWYVAAGVAARGPSILDVDAGLDRVESGRRRSPADPALADLHERLLAERAVRSGLAADQDRARAASRERIAADPANPAHHRWLGIVAAAAGDRATAAAALDRALALDPADEPARRVRAQLDRTR